MTRSTIGGILFLALTVLFVLRKREQEKKAAKRETLLERQGFVPITMDDADPDGITRLAGGAPRALRVISLVGMIFLIAVMAFFVVTVPLVRLIMIGALVLIAVIVLVWSLK